jgi:O-antigen/teichoic acid export membrane protein
MTRLMVRLLPLIVLGTGLCSLANIVLARTMSQDEYGAFAFFFSTISLMALIGLLGFQQTLPRFLTLYDREGKPELGLGFVLAAIALVALATAVTTVVGIYAVVPWIRDTASHRCLSDGYYLATTMALLTLVSAYLTYHRYALVSSGAGPDGAIYQAVLIATVLLALLLPHSHKGLLAVEVVAAMGVAVLTCLAVEVLWCSIRMPARIRSTRPHFQLRAWLAETLPVGGSAVVGSLVYSADVIAVRLIAGSGSAATYAVASSLASFVLIPRIAATQYFSQEAPHIDGGGRSARLQQLIVRVLRFAMLSGAAMAAGIALLHQPLLGLYGQNYHSAWPALLLLMAARALEGPVSIAVKLLNLEGHGRSLALSNLWTGIAFIALLGLLVSSMGQIGAALAVLVFVVLSGLIFHRSTAQATGLRLVPFARGTPLREDSVS